MRYAFRVTENLLNRTISIVPFKWLAKKYIKKDKLGIWGYEIDWFNYSYLTKTNIYPKPNEIVELKGD